MKRPLTKPNRMGVTLIEALMAVFLCSISIFMIRIGINLMSQLFQQSALTQIDMQAQVVLYGIIQDIRNANSIEVAEPNRLVLKCYRLEGAQPYDSMVNNALFDITKLGTLTYEFKTEDGVTFLDRKIEFPPAMNIPTVETKMLRNLLKAPVDPYKIFEQRGYLSAGNMDNIKVMFQLNVGAWNRAPRIYEAQASRRSSNAL